jgi:hypothetical protein
MLKKLIEAMHLSAFSRLSKWFPPGSVNIYSITAIVLLLFSIIGVYFVFLPKWTIAAGAGLNALYFGGRRWNLFERLIKAPLRRLWALLTGLCGGLTPVRGINRYTICPLVLLGCTIAANLFGALPAWTMVVATDIVLIVFYNPLRGAILIAMLTALLGPLVQPLLFVPVLLTTLTYVVFSQWRNGRRWWTLLLMAAATIVGMSMFYATVSTVLARLSNSFALTAWSFLPLVLTGGLALLVILAEYFWMRHRADNGQRNGKVIWTFCSVVAVAFISTVVLSAIALKSEDKQTLLLRNSMSVGIMSKFPTTVTTSRMLARATAHTYIRSQNRKYKSSTPAPHLQLRSNGKLWWQSSLLNDTFWGKWLGSAFGVVSVDAGRTDDHMEDTPYSGFLLGEQSWILENTIRQRHPFCTVGEKTTFLNDDGSWSLLMSYVCTRPSYTLVPFPYVGMVPYVGGVMETKQYGMVLDWSLSAAVKRFPGTVFFPPDLGRKMVDAYSRWRHGWSGTVLEVGVLEISEDEESARLNPQPIIQYLKNYGLQQLFFLEPKGDTPLSWVEMVMFDAQTGKMRSLEIPRGFNGPKLAISNIRGCDLRFNWNDTDKVDARLVVPDDEELASSAAEQRVYFLVNVLGRWVNEPDRHNYVGSVLVDSVKLADDSHCIQTVDQLNQVLEAGR